MHQKLLLTPVGCIALVKGGLVIGEEYVITNCKPASPSWFSFLAIEM